MVQVQVKNCAVLDCGTSSDKYPYLFFLKVPASPERRLLWCDSMGIPASKGRMFCCTRHFDIPEDFDGADSTEAGMRLKLKHFVLPHKAIPFLSHAKNIYSIFNEAYLTGKLEPTSKSILPAIELDLNVRIPLNVKYAAQEQAVNLVIDEVMRYFSSEEVKSRYQLVQRLKSQRNALYEIVHEKSPNGTFQGSLHYRKIQPTVANASEGCLQLTVDQKQLELLYFECSPKELQIFQRPPRNEQLPPQTDNNNFYPELFYTPGIRVNLVLPFLQVMRQVRSNADQFLVPSKNNPKPSESTPNSLDPFQKSDNSRSKPVRFSQNVTLEYLNILLDLLGTYEFMLGQRQRMALLFLLQQFKREFEECEMNELHVQYGYFLSPFKYFRVINEDVRPNDPDEDAYLYVKEVINPEVNFTIENAIGGEGELDSLENIFQPIVQYLVEGGETSDNKQYLKFAEMLRKAVTYTCTDCNMSFDSALAQITIQEHRFCGKKAWKCVNCNMAFDECDIAGSGWQHDCGNSVL
ncbi:conserved hypothetical protein [Culex quinquefasciatus]|uniref:THAP-type domain-containing protein n=1 Tax=Culex quinquefasciatus TaxID=7176 RepID=B0WZU6_CULQU|nr:conserved hypothetical protein [Culex quinquefasciatus]|eukprot:XP_001862918.1 conserved hypothetical protein [Culex quinquefasciatus]